ncbi:MAG: nuclear transport factor 2 family protein [Calditrichaceae bacterium]|nr:nuclear transport factor 2 family protein [Calditrichaceae bacterium]MBN2709777.1 nuclear transport factor 2 family protein [Calditrichaceae bacterium]
MQYFKFFFIVLVVFIGCQPNTKTEPFDLEAAKKVVNTQLDNLHQSSKAKDISFLRNMFTDDGLCLGTDPGEFWDKEQVINVNLHMFEDESMVFDYSIDKREIRFNPDGNSAICVEQFTWNSFSQKIPLRLVTHFININNDWKLDFVSWSLIPLNADLVKLNKALE